MYKIAIVGISNKPDCSPLDDSTNTGKIINRITSQFTEVEFYKTNLVNFAPLNELGKLRYPTKQEIEDNMSILLKNIKDSDVVICLGNKVTTCLVGKVVNLISIKHPSYMWVYKRKKLDSYINEVTEIIKEFLENNDLRNSAI